jgi:hypothetical protein
MIHVHIVALMVIISYLYKFVYIHCICGLCQSGLSTTVYSLLIVVRAAMTLERSCTWLTSWNWSWSLKLIYDRRSVGQSVLVSVSHLEPITTFLSDDCGFLDVGHLLWREDGSVIYLYNCFWALPEQPPLSRSPSKLTVIFYCLIWDSHNLESQVPIFISPRNRVAQLYRQALGSLLSPLTTRRSYSGGILSCLQTGLLPDFRVADSSFLRNLLLSASSLARPSCGDHSSSAPDAPSLRPAVPIGSLQAMVDSSGITYSGQISWTWVTDWKEERCCNTQMSWRFRHLFSWRKKNGSKHIN